MIAVGRIFFGVKGANPWMVLACIVLASLFEGIGLASLLPLVTVASGTVESDTSPLSRMVLDSLNSIGFKPEFEILVAVLIFALVLKAALTLFANIYVGHAVADVTTRLRQDVITSLLRVRWSYFVSKPVGGMLNTINNEAGRAGKAFEIAAILVATTIETFVYLLIALLLSWQLTLAALLVGSLMFAALSRLISYSRRAGQKQLRRNRQLMKIITDVLNNIKPLKAMSKQLSFERYIDKTLLKIRHTIQKQTSSKAALKGFQDILIAICIGVGLVVAVQVGKIPMLQVLLMFVVINKTVKNIAQLQARYQAWAALEAPVYAVKEAIAETELAAERCHGGVTPTLDTSCCIRNLSFSYGRNKVLHQINLDIPAKAMSVIMGVSGAGKSTLIDLILGFYDPEEGQVLVDDVPLTEVDITNWRKLIGYVPQDLALFHDTILDNITLGDESVTSQDVEDALKAAGAWDFVAELPKGVMTVVGEKGSKLSGGQRQRIALARAIAVRPKLLILDEVTSALDTKTEREICHTLSKLKDSTAILAITHRAQFLEFADRAYRLQDGFAEEIDTPARLAV